METTSLIPVIVVDNIQEAIDFYAKLGFVEEKEYTFADDTGAIVHAQLRKGGSLLFLGRAGVSYYKGPRADRIKSISPSERGLGLTLILQTDDLGSIIKFVREGNLEVLYGPANEWYGDKVFLFIDPFGYEWKVSQPLKDAGGKTA